MAAASACFKWMDLLEGQFDKEGLNLIPETMTCTLHYFSLSFPYTYLHYPNFYIYFFQYLSNRVKSLFSFQSWVDMDIIVSQLEEVGKTLILHIYKIGITKFPQESTYILYLCTTTIVCVNKNRCW
jgi:hypothetical protein